jgi:tripartite ATP-independent transporter DctM subunit
MMSNLTIGIIGILLLIVLMFARQWVAMTMFFVGILGVAVINGLSGALRLAGTLPYSQAANYSLACIPTFVFMGCMISISGIGADLYNAAAKWLARLRGGLAIATVVACGFFAAICGDSVATAVTFGKVSFPEMRKHGYKSGFAAGSIVSGGTIGIMIPPSIGFIIYGLLTEQSIGKLFMAGFIPGITQVLFYAVTIVIVCKLRPSYAPQTQSYPFREKLLALPSVIPVIVVFLFIMGGIYGGFFSPTEAGAMGATAVLIIGFAMRRMNPKKMMTALTESLYTSGMVFFIILSAFFFLRFITASGVATTLSELIVSFRNAFDVPPIIIIVIIAVFYLITGCFLDALAVILLTLPIVYPIILALGYDPIWWGVIMVRLLETSMITPPFGLNLFVLSKAIDHPLGDIYRGVAPFIISDLFHIILLVSVPQLSLFLPGMM